MYATLLSRTKAEDKQMDSYLSTPVIGTKVLYRDDDGHYITADDAKRMSLSPEKCFVDAMRTMGTDDPLIAQPFQSILSPCGALLGIEKRTECVMTGTQWKIDDISPCVIRQKSGRTAGAIILCTYKSNNLLARICGADGNLFVPVKGGVYACSLVDVDISMQMLYRLYGVDVYTPYTDVYYYNTAEKTLGIVDDMGGYVSACNKSDGIIKPFVVNKSVIRAFKRHGEQVKAWFPVDVTAA